jgi:glycosyltransferase involved in cell wall biosynthesis
MRLALVCRQIGHYHDARFRAASKRFDSFGVISAANEGGFAEFVTQSTGPYPVTRLYEGKDQFRSAVASGAAPAAVAEALDAMAPEVVAVGGWAAAESVAAIRWARRRRAGIVLMSDSQATDAKRRLAPREYLKSRVVRQCDSGLVGGATHRDYLVKLGMPAGRVQFGYDTIGNAHFADGAQAARANPGARSELGLPDRYLLASCRFIEKKNLPALIRAYARALTEDAPDLVILGDGVERPAVEAAVRQAGIEARVHLVGFRAYDVLPAYYGLAEAFVHVATSEQWGLVVNEAMAAGLPVVVSSACGASALVTHGVNGLIVDALDGDDMATALARLFRLTPAERAAMGRESSAIIADWGPERFADGLHAAAELARGSRSRGPLPPWDAALLDRLSRMVIEDVA